MPDFMVYPYAQCKTAESWSIKVKTYTVSFGWTPQGNDYSCTCKGFKFRGNCKHINENKHLHCAWLQFIDGDEPVDGNCPKCGGEIEFRNWAV